MEHGTPQSEAVELLLQEAGQKMADRATREAAWHLAKALGGFPLGLVIAGALVQQGESINGVASDIARLVEAEPDTSEVYPMIMPHSETNVPKQKWSWLGFCPYQPTDLWLGRVGGGKRPFLPARS